MRQHEKKTPTTTKRGAGEDPEESSLSLLKNHTKALAGVAQQIEYWPANQRVASSIPSQGTCLGYMPDPPVRGVQEATTR